MNRISGNGRRTVGEWLEKGVREHTESATTFNEQWLREKAIQG